MGFPALAPGTKRHGPPAVHRKSDGCEQPNRDAEAAKLPVPLLGPRSLADPLRPAVRRRFCDLRAGSSNHVRMPVTSREGISDIRLAQVLTTSPPPAGADP